MPVVVSLPPVTIVKVKASIDSIPAMSPSAPTPAATRCDTVSSSGSRRRRSISSVKYAIIDATASPTDSTASAIPPAWVLAATIASVQPSNCCAVLLGDAEIVRDDHRRQRLEQLGDDVAAAFGAQPLDPLDHELPHRGLDGLHLARSEAAGHQFAKFGVHRRVLHDERRVVLQANHFQLAVVDRQALGRRERLVVAGGVPHVGVPGQHPVVVVGALLGHDVVHRILVAQRLVHRPRVGPGLSRGEFEPGRRCGETEWRSCLMGTTQPHALSTLGHSELSLKWRRRDSGCPRGPAPA